MSHSFDPTARLILVPVIVIGPRLRHTFHFAVDVGATNTCIRPEFLRTLGFDLTRPVGRIRIRAATGTAMVPRYRVASVVSLGHTNTNFVIATQDLPITVEADGLLGLDFFRGLILNLDFNRGRVTLRSPNPRWQFWR